MFTKVRSYLNGSLGSILVGSLITIAIGLGGWNLRATADNQTKIASMQTKTEEHDKIHKVIEEDRKKMEKVFSDNFERIFNKLDKMDNYLRDMEKK